MDTLLVFSLFFIGLLFSIYNGVSILYPLLAGLIGFILVSLRRGYALNSLLAMVLSGCRRSLIVINIFVLIGVITAVWRACGTISFIVYYGIALISAKYFILSAFLLCCLVSFLLGTAFGTVGTVGVVLMVMAKGGHVDINMAAGAIIAGAYFGDRCSPLSSSANLVAALTNTQLHINIRNMARTSVLPFLLSVTGYIYLSLGNQLTFADQQITQAIASAFDIGLIVLLPAVIILLLAACRVDVKVAMMVSILAGTGIALGVQQIPPWQLLHYIVAGYTMDNGGFFAAIIQGGGLYSMVNVSLIVLLSSAYAGIFAGTGLLTEIEHFFTEVSKKISVYPSLILTSTATAAFSCNQTLAIMLTQQLAGKIYEKNRLSNYRLATDLENTVVLISALIPWNIAGAVPAAALAADAGFILYAFYLFLVPATSGLITQKIPVLSPPQ